MSIGDESVSLQLESHAKWLRQAAAEIAKDGHKGWGNTCLGAAEAIEKAIGHQPDCKKSSE